MRNLAATLILLVLIAGSALHTLAGYSSDADSSGHAWGCDDAYISYRYARNLVRGNGLVFNKGERVEGYSNFLYLLCITPAFYLTNLTGVYFYAVILNALFLVAAFWVFYSFVQQELGRKKALIAVLLFAACPALWAAVASGLETTLVLLLQVGIWVAVVRLMKGYHQRDVWILCGAVSLCVLARADGFLAPGIAIVYLLLMRKWRIAFLASMAFLLTLVPYILFRYEYYGHLLPNTYYVKVTGAISLRVHNGIHQLGSIALTDGLVVYLVVCLWVLAGVIYKFTRMGKKALEGGSFGTFFVLCWLAYWIYIGGDNLGDRFLLILFPLGIYALLRQLDTTVHRRRLWYAVGLIVLLQLRPLIADPRFDYTFNKYDCWVTLGKFLGREYSHKTIAIDAAGKVPYFSDFETLDMLGLNDPHIARGTPSHAGSYQVGHSKFDPDYILSRKPDFIAGWVSPSRGLAFGLTRAKYEMAGYRLKYLVNSERKTAGTNIIDMGNWTDPSILKLVAAGYRYAVLERNHASPIPTG